MQAAMDACPVSCIHWVPREQLPALEYTMQRRMGRCNVGIMMGGCGGSRGDVWAATEAFLKERRERCAPACMPPDAAAVPKQAFATHALLVHHSAVRACMRPTQVACPRNWLMHPWLAHDAARPLLRQQAPYP
jgi:hypothetical protein